MPETEANSTTRWFCKKCQTEFLVQMPPDADVWRAIEAIGRSHRELAPGCAGNINAWHIVMAAQTAAARLSAGGRS